ncbi:glycerophosphodiester phosphodiesterase family protein [Taibaiella koreensis]|uniref:glycerophosphodiester phosphodiesterase family protein n=1 Tax=Taibaiella koreensis TaxID=1268548 RepID=UPI0013C332E2|nr:glycerophosphodiester phosphodiesterase family protein [Taibaiella koreensis]
MKKIALLIAFLQAGALFAQGTKTPQNILNRFLHPGNNYVLVAAHRGDWRNAPENSIHALNLCLEMGVDIMETDVVKTKDGVLILMHDQKIDRTTSGKGLVSELTWDYLMELTLRQGHGGPTEEHIPTFEAFMLAVKGKPILINLDKCWDIIPDVYAVLKKTGTVEQGLFKGNLPLPELRKKFGPVMDSIHYIAMISPGSFEGNPKGDQAPLNLIDGFFNHYRPAGFELGFDKEHSPVVTQCIPGVRAKGVTVWLNALWASQNAGHDDENAMSDPDANWGYLLQLGANAIQTDRPHELLEYLRRKRLHD